MKKLEVFDPAMCCTTGICGTSIDPKLVVFASDLEWLKMQGVHVIRHGLTLEPNEFIKNETVKNLVHKEKNKCLPIFLLDGELVLKSNYPSREKLAEICKIEFNEEEAPPIHREENCCCGIDCDCGAAQMPDGLCKKTVQAEDNFSNSTQHEFRKYNFVGNFIVALFIVALIIIIWIIVKLFTIS